MLLIVALFGPLVSSVLYSTHQEEEFPALWPFWTIGACCVVFYIVHRVTNQTKRRKPIQLSAVDGSARVPSVKCHPKPQLVSSAEVYCIDTVRTTD
jgi:hypothetical protein